MIPDRLREFGTQASGHRMVIAQYTLFVALLAVILPLSGAASQRDRIVRAERFEVMDGRGRLRATLGASPNGSVRLALLDVTGTERALLMVDSSGAAQLSFFDSNFTTVRLAGNQESPVLLLAGPRGSRMQAELGVAWMGGDGFRSLSARGVVSGMNGAYLYLQDPNGEASLGTDPLRGTGWPALVLRDQASRPRAVLGSTRWTFSSGVTETWPVSSIGLFDERGNLIWRAP